MLTHRAAIRWIGILAVTVLIALFAASLATNFLNRTKNGLQEFGTVPVFSLTERSGKQFTREDLIEKISVVDFIFTSCPGACPVMSAAMAGLYRDFARQPRVQFVSISVDPDTDTLPVLTRYAGEYGVTDDRWVFLRGPIEEVKTLSERGFMLAAGNLPMGHSTKFVLVDGRGIIRGYYDSHDDDSIQTLKNDIGILLQP